jgi:maltose O-acetyltransferase
MTATFPSERQRMLRGDPYDSRDPELLALAHRARSLLAAFSAVPSTDSAARHAVLATLLGNVDDGVWIEPPFFCDYGQHIVIGPDSFINTNCIFLDSATITIGANVLIGPGVQLLTVSHPLRAADRIVPAAMRKPEQAPYRTHARPIVIHDNAWIGAGTIVLPGVTIGAGAVIGAASLVTSDVPADSLAFGVPCRVNRAL